MHIRRLEVKFHEYCLMKMFMVSLEGKARSWYKKLGPSSLYSLGYFHTTFYKKYKEHYPSSLLVKNYCTYFENFIECLEIFYDDEEIMDEEILEVLNENPFQRREQKLEANCHTQETFQHIIISPLIETQRSETKHNLEFQDSYQQTPFSPFPENEVDHNISLVNNYEWNQQLDVETHVPSHEIDEGLQPVYQLLWIKIQVRTTNPLDY
jgi:hypothetical protein